MLLNPLIESPNAVPTIALSHKGVLRTRSLPEFDRFKEDGQLAAVMKQYPVVLPSVGSTKEKNPARKQGVSIVGADPSGAVS